jgi:hypothetical protein
MGNYQKVAPIRHFKTVFKRGFLARGLPAYPNIEELKPELGWKFTSSRLFVQVESHPLEISKH